MKISLLGGALTLLPKGLRAASLSAAPPRCRVSVVRRSCFDDLQSCYLDDPETGFCPILTDDFNEILELGGEMPDHLKGRFCEKAWKALCQSIADSTDCSGGAHAKLASCGDPTRPVIFKIETL